MQHRLRGVSAACVALSLAAALAIGARSGCVREARVGKAGSRPPSPAAEGSTERGLTAAEGGRPAGSAPHREAAAARDRISWELSDADLPVRGAQASESGASRTGEVVEEESRPIASAWDELGGRFPLELDPPDPGAAGLVEVVTGFDPHGPRIVDLWRIEGDRRLLLRQGLSGRDGELEFSPLVRPRDGMQLVATPAGRDPDAHGASELHTIPPRAPRAPGVRQLEGAGMGAPALRLVPAETTGALVVRDGAGRVLARWELPARPDAAARSVDVVLDVAPESGEVWVAHEFEDGRRSAWRRVELRGGASNDPVPGVEEGRG